MRELPTDTDTDTLLTVAGLSAAYDDTRVLTDIALRVRANETVALLGPNGHGKTTVLRAISGLHRHKQGTVTFDGADITRDPPHRIVERGLIHVPQGDLLFGDMTITENLLVGAYLPRAWRERRERLERVWSVFGRIHERRDALARNLSGGERRMVAIGRGLMADVKLIMIDEPSLGLAPVASDALYAALAELRASGLTTLLVEESPERVAGVADRVYLLDTGSIVFAGTTAELTHDGAMLETYFG